MESFIQRKNNDCNEEGEEIYESLVLGRGEIVITREKEHMFDKVVTPSDVGKLNRLVIPKQYAEKYFPLDSSTNDNKGLLLNFEDRNGKPWRFRYSYWNSSQSYVMTKGWSRFVKDKKLDAGDIVSFLRGGGGGCGVGGDSSGNDLLFIDWRRRPETLLLPPPMVRGHQYLSFHHPYYLQQGCPHHQLHLNRYGMCMNENPFQSPYRVGTGIEMIQMMQIQTNDDGDEIDEDEERMVFESVPVVQGKAVGKRLRLFGVNMEYCPISESSEAILSSTAVAAGVNAPPPSSASSSSAAASLMPYSYIGKPLLQKMSSDNILNKGKGSLSLDFDV